MKNYFHKGITKPCTQLHPAPSTSSQLISASTLLSATPSTIFEPKYHTWLGNFPKFRLKHSKLSILSENWLTRYVGGADSESRLRFLKFRPQNPFLGKFGLKMSNCPFCLKIGTHGISRMLILIPTLIFWNSNPKIYFWANLGQKSQSCAFCLKIASHGISRMLILIPTIVFWIFNSKFLFGQIWTQKVKVVPFV